MAILHVKSPSGTDYNMTIVTSGVSESIEESGWCKLPNGLLIQWLRITDDLAWLQKRPFNIKFNECWFVTANRAPTIPSSGNISSLYISGNIWAPGSEYAYWEIIIPSQTPGSHSFADASYTVRSLDWGNVFAIGH